MLPTGAPPKETKVRPLADLKVLDAGAGSPGGFTGYGSVFGELDSEGDVVAKGAYTDTLPQFIERGFVAWSHDWASPVATIKAAREDGRGLFLEAEFHSDPQSQVARTRTAERLARGKFMGLSIGYVPLEFDRTEKGRRLTRIELFETSLVTVPALASAGVLNAKAGRRLSAATQERIRAAMETLRELLGEDVLEGTDAPAPTGDPVDPAASEADALRAAGERLAAELAGYATRLAAAPPAEVALLGTSCAGVLRGLAVARARLDTALERAADPDGLAPHALHRRFATLSERFAELATAVH